MTNLILVVDDEDLERKYLCEQIAKAGYQVVEASNGSEALAICTQLYPDIVLLDASMPVMDAFSCCAQLQALPNSKDTPVLMITAADEQANVEQAFAIGVTDCITKPIQWPVLRQRLHHFLETRQTIRRLQQQEAQIKTVLNAARISIWNWNLLTNKFTCSDKSGSSDTYDAFIDCIHPQDRDFVKRSHQQAIQDGVEYEIEFRVILSDGSICTLASKGNVLHNQASAAVGLSGVNIDITKYKQAQELLTISKHQVRSDYTQAVWDEDGNVAQIVTSGNDITERKLAQEQLRQSEERFQIVARATNDVLWDWNLLTNQMWFSQAVQTLFGYSTEQVIDSVNWLYERIHQDDRHRITTDIGVVINSGQQFWSNEYRFCRSDGSYAYILDRGYVVHDHTGKPVRMIGAMMDISDRKRTQAELLRQNMRSQLFADVTLKIRQSLQIDEILQTSVTEVQKLLHADRVLIMRLHSNGSVVAVQEAVVPGLPNILGQEINDPCFREIYIQKYRLEAIGAINDIKQAGTQSCHIELLQKFHVKANLVVPIFLKSQLWGLLIAHQCAHPRQWTNWEIELLRQLADQIGIALAQSQILEQETRQRQELSRSNEELQQFAFIASHDLQEPLRKIKTFGERLKATSGDKLTVQGLDYLERMQSAASRMQILIEDLLTLSRVTTRAQPFIPVNLTEIAQEVLSDLEVRIQQTKAHIEIGELPTIRADPLQMRQLLQNLIGNALKFHRPQVPPIVKIFSQLWKNQSEKLCNCCDNCQIIIEDNGIGFEEKYLDRIFNVFQRLHSRSEYEGTGMGLAICRKIAERHHGKITAQSKPGQGAKFIVTLPINFPN
ncbi:MAG: PAS domain-containing protein [Desmonostoc vinosum HA7617-LM4]|jgi:PAS domain S-box-containing protein|nr:PAS domain-containing protein [Desmonostoc vinosum HA7617-LM4]